MRTHTTGLCNQGHIASPPWRAALALVFSSTFFFVSVGQADEPVIRQDAPFPAIFDPTTGARYEVLRGDFHMHTVHSDGTFSPSERVVEAWRYGYDVIAITDHRNFQAYDHALPTAEALGMILLRGMETGLDDQEHVVTFDFAAEYEPRQPHQWAETEGQATVFYQQQWQRLAARGGFALYAHPHVGLREPMLWGIDHGLLAGIEIKNVVVANEWNTVESHGTYWYPFAFDWAIEHHLTIFANSDVHEARDPADPAFTLVLASDWSRAGVMEALRSGRTVAWFNQMLCGHEAVLAMLMESLVDIQRLKLESNTTHLRFRNYGPVPVTARIIGKPLAPITLGPYEDVLVGVRRISDTVTIAWTNVHTSSTTTLTTTHTLTAAASSD